VAQPLRERAGGAVAGDLVVLDALRRGDQGGVLDVGVPPAPTTSSPSAISPFIASQAFDLAVLPRMPNGFSRRETWPSVSRR
jgi:hypothetical protein